jgi:galactokinase
MGGDGNEAGALAQCVDRMERKAAENPCALGEAWCAALGNAGTVMHLRTRPHHVVGNIDLPTGVTFCGVDCGQNVPLVTQSYLDMRTTVFMGWKIIERIFQSQPRTSGPWDGRLSSISIDEYVTTLRDRLPTKMKGQAFLDRFGPGDDSFIRIDPKATYKVRSRAEHPIYEHARVRQFADGLRHAGHSQRLASLLEIGELMYSSHWSYGQRCALGSIETDALVSALRKCGPNEGIYGARVSGRGSGGVVTVLMADTEAARSAVRQVTEAVGGRLHREFHVYEGSQAGAFLTGVRDFP